MGEGPLKAIRHKQEAAATGLLISFDGLDSTGKATQVKQLATRLRYVGYAVRTLQSPDYTTPTGQELKERLQNKKGDWHSTPWEQKMKLFAANRAEHRTELLRALDDGEIVLYDRYVPSSLAFITVEALPAQEVDLYRASVQQTVAKEEYEKHHMPREGASIFLDVPPVVSANLLARRKQVHNEDDEYTDHIDVQQRLYNEYDLLCQNNPSHFLRIRCVEGEELLSIEDVTELVWETLRHKFIRFQQPDAHD